jgi:hypothetical protein
MIFQGVYFWNYFDEPFDVDQLDFEFFNLQDEVVANYTEFPSIGVNPVIAELLDLSGGVFSSRGSKMLSSANGKLDFKNFVFRAADV